ncbi:MAG: hypothetical protein WC648_04900, partial [Candidatus Paceibacterota bacterium]
MPNWWDEIGNGLGQLIEDAKERLTGLDKDVFGGALPGGYETPENTPVSSGVEEAFEQAGNETVNAPIWEGGHLTSAWGLRDVPVVGDALRAAEVPLNLLNQVSARTWQPFFGAMEAENPGEEMKRKGGSDWWQEQLATMSEKDFGMGRVRKGWEAMTGTPEQQEEGRRKFSELSTGQQLFGIATDPTNFIGIPGPLKPTAIKRGVEAAKVLKPWAEMSRAERVIGGVAKAADDMPLEQMRKGNILERSRIPIVSQLATLTGKSKVAQDVASTQDQVVGRLSSFMREAGEDFEQADLAKVAATVQDMIAPTPTSAARWGKSAESFEANVTRKTLATFDPNSIVTKYKAGQEAQKLVADLKAAAAAGEKIDGTALAKATQAAEKLPKNKAEAVAQYGRDLIEHANVVARKAYKVPDADKGLDKVINWQKNVLASTLLAANPNYPVQNAVSNFTWSLVSGYNPFRTSGKSERVMREAGMMVKGFAPSRAAAKMGMADVEAKGWQRFSAMGLAQWLEKVQGEGIWTQAFQKFLHQGKNKLIPQEYMGAQTRAALDAVRPGLSKWVDDVVRYGADTPAEAIKKINNLPGFSGEAGLPALVNLLPKEFVEQGDLMAALDRLGFDVLDEELGKAKDITQFQRVVAAFKENIAKLRSEAEAMGGGVDARGEILRFIDDLTGERSATFAKAAERRLAGGVVQDVAADLANYFDESRGVLEELTTKLRGTLKGGLPAKQLDAFEGTFKRWRDRTSEYQAIIKDINTKFADNPNALAVAKADAARAYTKDMRGIRSGATKTVTGMLTGVYKVPDAKKPMLSAYWKKVLNPMPKEEGWLDEYLTAIVNAKDDAARKAASDAFHAKRQAAWEKENANISRMGKEIFGEAAEQAPMPTPKAGAAVPDEGNAYRTLAQIQWDTLDKTLDDVLRQAEGILGEGRMPGQVDNMTRKNVVNAVQSLNPAFEDAKLAAMRMANADRDFALLNYSHRYNFDHYLSLVMPFAFWQNTMAKNMAVRYLEQPGIFFAYSRYKEMLNEAENDPTFPARLRGMIRVSLPGAPDWMGDQFIDPLGRAMPFNQMMYPFQAQQWEQEGEQGIGGMAQLMGSPSPLITTPINLMTGKGKEVSTLLPLTRQVKGLTAMAREKFPELEGKIPAGGLNIETMGPGGGVRGLMRKIDPTVPDVDQWDEYRINRMLSDMTSNGEITPEQAKRAMAT